MRKLFYCSLEKYESRYTLQLTDWVERVLKKRNINYEVVYGDTLNNSGAISVGQVLDAHGRSYYSMSQMMKLVKMMQEGKITSEDCILFEDMFTPGIESLPYIMNQVPEQYRPKVYVRCLAQTIDEDDFTWVTGMEQWMGHYEKMVDSFVSGILASSEEMVAHIKIAGWKAPVYNISGLAFGKEEVKNRVNNITSFSNRPKRVVFAARFDREKQPDFFMDIVELWNKTYPNSGIEFAVLSGKPLVSNEHALVERARYLEKNGQLKIYENLSKNEYYEFLNNSRVMINTALQDWVSNTVSEADALGCNVLFPAYKSFPETFSNDEERLYIPWSTTDVIQKLKILLEAQHRNLGKISDWTDKTNDRIIDIIEGHGNKWLRSDNNYRKHVRENKF